MYSITVLAPSDRAKTFQSFRKIFRTMDAPTACDERSHDYGVSSEHHRYLSYDSTVDLFSLKQHEKKRKLELCTGEASAVEDATTEQRKKSRQIHAE